MNYVRKDNNYTKLLQDYCHEIYWKSKKLYDITAYTATDSGMIDLEDVLQLLGDIAKQTNDTRTFGAMFLSLETDYNERRDALDTETMQAVKNGNINEL